MDDLTNFGSDGQTASGTVRKDAIAKSRVEDGVITFTFVNGRTVTCDVTKINDTIMREHAINGVRDDIRMAYQKIDDLDQAADAAEAHIKTLLDGTWRRGVRTNGDGRPDDLTVALAAVLGMSTEHIESVFYANYFRQHCSESRTKTGAVRMNGKGAALAKLRENPQVAQQLAKIATERSRGSGKVAKEDLRAFVE